MTSRSPLAAALALALLPVPAAASHRSPDFRVVVRGADGVARVVPAPAAPATAVAAGATGVELLVAEIAAAADFEFFQQCGSSVAATVAEIEASLAACSAAFEAGPGITLQVTTIVVEAAEPDPYTTADPLALLEQFRDEWLTHQSGVQRDLAHLFTGKDLSGAILGLALFGAVCDPETAFSLSSPKAVAEPLGTQVTCKQLARVFGAPTCDVEPDCGLMCGAIGGCAGDPNQFGAEASAAMLATALDGGCLEPAMPVLQALAPDGGPAFGAGAVTLTGAQLAGTTHVLFGGVPVPFAVVDPSTILAQAPLASTLGAVPVTVVTAAGESDPLPFDFEVTDPPGLDAPAASTPGAPFVWTFGGDPLDFWALLAQVDDASTVPFGPWSLLAAPLVLEVGALNGAGTAETSLVAPALGGVDLFFQVWTFDESSLALAGATNLAVSVGS